MFAKEIKFGGWLLALIGCLLSSLACNKDLGQQMLYNKARNLHDHGYIDKAIEVYKKVLKMAGDNMKLIMI